MKMNEVRSVIWLKLEERPDSTKEKINRNYFELSCDLSIFFIVWKKLFYEQTHKPVRQFHTIDMDCRQKHRSSRQASAL